MTTPDNAERTPHTGGRPALPRTMSGRVQAARAALWWERAWPALWPSVGVLGAYGALALVGLFETWNLLPAWVALLTILGTAGYLASRNQTWLAMPSHDEGLRRLEEMNNLPHRPLSTYEDQPAAGTGSDVLWAAHRQWLKDRLKVLRAKWPSPGLAAHDPYALRGALVVCLVAAFAIAGPLSGSRLAQAFFPGFTGAGSLGQVDAWVTPPDYTGRAPLFLNQTTDKTVTVPTGSEITAHVFGGSKPQISLGAAPLAIEANTSKGETAYETNALVETDTVLSITQGGRDQGAWSLTVIPDDAPLITLVEATATRRQTLKLVYEMADDYGVTDLTMDLELDPIFVLEDKWIFQLGGDRKRVV